MCRKVMKTIYFWKYKYIEQLENIHFREHPTACEYHWQSFSCEIFVHLSDSDSSSLEDTAFAFAFPLSLIFLCVFFFLIGTTLPDPPSESSNGFPPHFKTLQDEPIDRHYFQIPIIQCQELNPWIV